MHRRAMGGNGPGIQGTERRLRSEFRAPRAVAPATRYGARLERQKYFAQEKPVQVTRKFRDVINAREDSSSRASEFHIVFARAALAQDSERSCDFTAGAGPRRSNSPDVTKAARERTHA